MEVLRKQLREIEALSSIRSLLAWDQQVTIPAGAHAARKEQSETLALVIHERQTSKELRESLKRLSHMDLSALSGMEKATVREATRDYTRAVKMPPDLQKRLSGLEVVGPEQWNRARKEANFELMAPVLTDWILALKEEAAAIAPELQPYDYLLDKFERGSTMERMDHMFKSLKHPLINLLRKVMTARPKNHEPAPFSFPVEFQKELSRNIAQDMGYKFENGRLDDSSHPMTLDIASPTDVRITSRFVETDPGSGILATIHETGHALYEQGRACEPGLTASRVPSMGLHESQSLLWERSVGLSRHFWEHYWPVVTTKLVNTKATFDDFYLHLNEVEPSLVRVDADEVTYPLHVLLRYEIEKGLFDGSLSVSDVPKVWNQKMKEYLGVEVPDDSQGCLQDIHWSMGGFGYFPSYVIGAIYAYQIFEAAEKDMKLELGQEIGNGRFLPLREWLREKIHIVGSTYETPDELVRVVTGKGMDPDGFIGYLTRKYTEIYNLK